MDNKKQLTEQLIKTTHEVRRKCNSLKRNKYDDEIFLEKSYKPITKPLKELVEKFQIKSEPSSSLSSFSSPPKRYKKEENHETSSSDDTEDKYDSAEDRDYDDDQNSDHNNREDHERIMRYLMMVDNNSSKIDKCYGVYVEFEKNQHNNNKKVYKLGNASNIITSTMKININGKEYNQTDGLCELVFLKDPATYSKHDLDTYAEIIQRCNVYYRNFDSNGQIKGTNTTKYRMIIKPIADQQKKKYSGKGLNLMQIPKQNTDYIYWDDPNELIDRLRLLISSTQAGHNNHDNEIMSIVQELREAKIIL